MNKRLFDLIVNTTSGAAMGVCFITSIVLMKKPELVMAAWFLVSLALANLLLLIYRAIGAAQGGNS